eukprot:1240779-Prymnesium_polylepis.1
MLAVAALLQAGGVATRGSERSEWTRRLDGSANPDEGGGVSIFYFLEVFAISILIGLGLTRLYERSLPPARRVLQRILTGQARPSIASLVRSASVSQEDSGSPMHPANLEEGIGAGNDAAPGGQSGTGDAGKKRAPSRLQNAFDDVQPPNGWANG